MRKFILYEKVYCQTCNGTGIRREPFPKHLLKPGEYPFTEVDCLDCNGSGETLKEVNLRDALDTINGLTGE